MFDGLLSRVNPKSCLAPCVAAGEAGEKDEDGLSSSVPGILSELEDTRGASRLDALRRLYALTRVDGGRRRIKLVCTSKWDVVTALSSCLVVTQAGDAKEKEAAEVRKVALLALNNLSIPNDNKAVMSLGAASEALLGALTRVVGGLSPESYLCLSCLMNLTYLEDAVEPVLFFCPDRVSAGVCGGPARELQLPLERPESLLRAVERMMLTFVPYVKKDVRSVEVDALRWAMGFLRNVTVTETAARLVSVTDIPRAVVASIQNSPRPTVKWTKDSMEEMALQIICNLANFSESRIVLRSAGAMDIADRVVGAGGIHDFRASMLKCSLDI